MASTFRRTVSTPPEPCESDERALDCLRDCVRRSGPRGPGALSDGESRPARPQHDQATPDRKRQRRSAGQVGRGSSSGARARQFRSSPIGNAERVPRPDGPENFPAHAWMSTLSLSALVALALSLFLSHLWMAMSVGPVGGLLSVVAYLATVRRRRIDA